MAIEPLRVLEFYSGIGGMHYAMKGTGIPYHIVAALELNDVANRVYKHNFPNDNLKQTNIEGLTTRNMEDFQADVILMSPPCQPFTRLGNQKASSDPRTKSFLNILQILKSMKNPPKYILLENVKGFETSETRKQLVDVLSSTGYKYQEFLISPIQFGIPNSRLRYYLLAKLNLEFPFTTSSDPMDHMPQQSSGLSSDVTSGTESIQNSNCGADINRPHLEPKNSKEECSLSEYLEENAENEEFYLSGEILGRLGTVLDIVIPSSKRSCCFTKAYGTYVKGTGSVITTTKSEDEIRQTFENLEGETDERLRNDRLLSLKLRYFSPQEVANLMCFPRSFGFPSSTTNKQKYKLLGNSVNVHVVTELLKTCLLTEYR